MFCSERFSVCLLSISGWNALMACATSLLSMSMQIRFGIAMSAFAISEKLHTRLSVCVQPSSRMPRHSCCEVRVMQLHDILLLRTSAILPEAISAGGLTPPLIQACFSPPIGGSHLLADIQPEKRALCKTCYICVFQVNIQMLFLHDIPIRGLWKMQIM